MCGFVGYLGGSSSDGIKGEEGMLQRMADTLLHRGPDHGGYWCDSEQRIGLGHRRLSILDLSPAGHQPMRSATGRYMIALNGEIYNHLLLRGVLESDGKAPSWRGHSDTETLLAGFEAWGLAETVQKAIGMFAFAVWDNHSRTLTLARDRVGEKPVYYGWQGRAGPPAFLFGSELKALKVHPAFDNSIDRGALSRYLRYSCIPAPYSIYKGIFKLTPGSLLTISLQSPDPKVSTYWSGAHIAESGVANAFKGGPDEAVDELEALLKGAVRQQMISDVPLGAFLSGGVDSSTVVALMQAQSSAPVKTFTIGFHEQGYNEAEHAKAVARHLGTDHTELYVTAEQAMAVIPRLPILYDEPFADSSQIPTFLVSQLAREHVSVSLSGDAGDELFCGYNRYHVTANKWRKLVMDMMPIPLRRLVASGLMCVTPQIWTRLADALGDLLPRSLEFSNFGDKLHKGAAVLALSSPDALYYGLVSHWHDPVSVVLEGYESAIGNAHSLKGLDDAQRMMLLDMLTYLPDDILVKVDRAAMGVSLETRTPILDHRVVEFAWRLPQSLKLRDGQTKWVLRQVLYRHVPPSLIERPKMGFGVPIDGWLRGPLREWTEELLNESRLKREGYFNPAPIRLKWQEHMSGKRNWQSQLWIVLMFQAWLEAEKSSAIGAI